MPCIRWCLGNRTRILMGLGRFHNQMFIEQGLTETPIDPTSPDELCQAVLDFRGEPVIMEGYRRIRALLVDDYALLANCSNVHAERTKMGLSLLASSTRLANATIVFLSPATHKPGRRVGDSAALEPWSVLWLAVSSD